MHPYWECSVCLCVNEGAVVLAAPYLLLSDVNRMKRLILLLCVCLTLPLSFAQVPVMPFAEWLTVDTSLVIGSVQDVSQKNWVATVCQDKFCFCQRRGFSPQGKEYRCVIHRVDMSDFHQDTICVGYPNMGSTWKRDAQACCIYAMSFENDRLLLVCDNQLLLYQQFKQGYKFVHRWFCMGVCSGYLYQHRIYAIVDDKEKSVYRWLCYEKESAQQGNVVRELIQPASFLLQFEPNRYLFVNEHCLYYIPPGECVVQRFSLQGELLDSVRYELPYAKPFPPDLLAQLRGMPYGTERIFYALNRQYRQYSFAKTIDPLGDSLLLLSVNLGDDDRRGQLAVLRLRHDPKGWQQDFSTLAISDTGQIYAFGLYPVSYHLSGDNLLTYPCRDKMLQLLVTSEQEVYEGKSVMQYRRYKDSWFKNHDPVVKLRVQAVRKECVFYDYENQRVSLTDLKHDKVIMLVNHQPQCSACQKYLLRFLSLVDTSQVALVSYMGQVDDYLSRRQQLRQMSELSPLFYQPLYAVEGEHYGGLQLCKSYPALYLWQRDVGFVGVYGTNDIFTSDYDHYELSDVFLNDFRRFVGN